MALTKISSFDEAKTTQAAACFMKLANGRLPIQKLMKLLYLLDRTSLDRTGFTVTNASYSCTKLGPALNEVADLLLEPDWAGAWHEYISAPTKNEIQLLREPGVESLSESEEDLIAEIYTNFGGYQARELVDKLKTLLPECQDVKTGRLPLTLAEILQALNKPPSEIAGILQLNAAVSQVHTLFS